MILNKTTFSACAVVMSALLIQSCSQSPDGQASSSSDTKYDSTVSLSSSKVSVDDGEFFTLDVTASDLAVSEGGAVSLSFDPALVQVSSVNVDSSTWNFVNQNGSVDNVKGTISDIVFSSYQGVSGDAVLATIEFKSINKGASSIAVTASDVNPFASNGEVLNVLFETANVTAN